MDMAQHGTEYGEGEPHCSYEDLPTDFILLLYNTLPLRDLVAASCTCKQWLRCSERLWEGRVRARWQHWKQPLPVGSSSSMSPRAWRDLYRQRHERDTSIFLLLQDACWPVKQEAAFSAFMDMGADAIDALAVAAHSSCASSMFLGVTYHAHVALHYVVGEQSAVRLRQLLQECLDNEGASQGTAPEGAAAAAALDAEPAFGGASGPGSSSSSSSSDSQGAASAAAASTAGAASRSEVEASLEGALMLAQALHPLSDVGAVRRLVGQLGTELTRRMEQAQALPGSRQAVELLNKLMFGPRSTATATASAAPTPTPAAAPPTPTPAAASSSSGGTPPSSSSAAAAAAPAGSAAAASAGDGGLRFPWWRRNKELDGPDLSGLAVPKGGTAGLGLQGNSSSYYATSNSCLDSVLASRAGLPITLALLHAAVGEAAGLRVQLVGMPGHVITRALIGVQGSQGSAGTGLNPGSRGSGADAGEGVAGGEDTGGSGSSSSGAQAQQGEEPNGGSDEGRVGVQGSRSDSWMYVDVFNGGVELSDDDLRMLALRHNFPVDGMQELLQPMSAGATLRRMTLNLINSVRMGYASHVGRLDMLKPPLHQLQLRSISVALLSLHLASAFSSSIPAREAFDMGVQLSQLIGLGHTKGPPGGVLLMRKLADVLPPSLAGWRVKIEAGIQGEVEAKERQQQQRQARAWMHSKHPAVRQRVGDTMRGDTPGTIVAWRTIPITDVARTVQKPPTYENVAYKLLFDDGTIQDVDQAGGAGLNTREQLLQHQEQQQLLYIAREEACSAECKRQLQHLQCCWFEQDFVAGLRPVVHAVRQQRQHLHQVEMMTDEEMKALPEQFRDQVLYVKQQIALGAVEVEAAWPDQSGWPDRHLSHGQHFEAWVLPQDPDQDDWFWLNASLRVEFPEG